MYYVYMKRISDGREEYVGCFDTPSEAINKIAQCYGIDKRQLSLGEYYYFMKKH